MKDQVTVHNEIVPEIIKRIYSSVQENDGKYSDMWVILESIVVGICIVTIKLGGDEKMIDELVTHVKERLAKDRLENIKTEGQG